MPTEIPSIEDFRRLEAKLDQVLKLLEGQKLTAPVTEGRYIEKSIMISESHLNICSKTLKKYEQQGLFTPIKRGRKTYYTLEQYHAYMQHKGIKLSVVEKRLKGV